MDFAAAFAPPPPLHGFEGLFNLSQASLELEENPFDMPREEFVSKMDNLQWIFNSLIGQISNESANFFGNCIANLTVIKNFRSFSNESLSLAFNQLTEIEALFRNPTTVRSSILRESIASKSWEYLATVTQQKTQLQELARQHTFAVPQRKCGKSARRPQTKPNVV